MAAWQALDQGCKDKRQAERATEIEAPINKCHTHCADKTCNTGHRLTGRRKAEQQLGVDAGNGRHLPPERAQGTAAGAGFALHGGQHRFMMTGICAGAKVKQSFSRQQRAPYNPAKVAPAQQVMEGGEVAGAWSDIPI